MTSQIDSFTVLTSGVPAYYDGQGIANMLYKTGTNQVHADIFENNRNTVFDANYYFNKPNTNRGVEHQNEYAASLSPAAAPSGKIAPGASAASIVSSTPQRPAPIW